MQTALHRCYTWQRRARRCLGAAHTSLTALVSSCFIQSNFIPCSSPNPSFVETRREGGALPLTTRGLRFGLRKISILTHWKENGALVCDCITPAQRGHRTAPKHGKQNEQPTNLLLRHNPAMPATSPRSPLPLLAGRNPSSQPSLLRQATPLLHLHPQVCQKRVHINSGLHLIKLWGVKYRIPIQFHSRLSIGASSLVHLVRAPCQEAYGLAVRQRQPPMQTNNTLQRNKKTRASRCLTINICLTYFFSPSKYQLLQRCREAALG